MKELIYRAGLLIRHAVTFVCVVIAAFCAVSILPGGQTFTGMTANGFSTFAQSLTQGIGILISGGVVSVNPAIIPQMTVYTGTITITGSIGANTCSDYTTITATGAVPGDIIAQGAPATLEGNIVTQAFISSANVLKVRFCNNSAGSITPANQPFSVGVLRLNY